MGRGLIAGQMRPNINLNGTSREELVEQRMDAVECLNAALASLRGHHPHGRDYQGYPDDNMLNRDVALWDSRYKRLSDLLTEISDELDAIQSGEL